MSKKQDAEQKEAHFRGNVRGLLDAIEQFVYRRGDHNATVGSDLMWRMKLVRDELNAEVKP